MENTISWIKISGAGICSALSYLLGGWDLMLKILVTLTVLDFISGMLSAFYHKTLSSDIAFKGIIRKTGIYIIVAVAFLLDQLMNTNNILRGATIGFYIAVEGLSIVENWASMELPLPKAVRNALTQMKE